MPTYKNPYPKLIPSIILRIVDTVTLQVTSILDRLISQEVSARILSNMIVLLVLSPVLLIFIESQTGTLLLEQVYTNSLFYLAIFFISYSLSYRQLAPRVPTERTTESPTVGYPTSLLLLTVFFCSTLIANHIFVSTQYALLSLLTVGVIQLLYVKRTVTEDLKSEEMDMYRLEKWMPLTGGIGYTYLFAVLFTGGVHLTVLGCAYMIMVLYFYRFRSKRYTSERQYTLDTLYEREPISEEDVVDTLQSLYQTGAIQQQPKAVLRDNSERLSEVLDGDQTIEEFVQELTSATDSEMKISEMSSSNTANSSQTLQEMNNEELRQDIIWTWEECRDQLNQYRDEDLPSNEELSLDSYTKQDLEQLQSRLQEIEDGIEDENTIPAQVLVTVQRLQESIDNAINELNSI